MVGGPVVCDRWESALRLCCAAAGALAGLRAGGVAPGGPSVGTRTGSRHRRWAGPVRVPSRI